MALQHARRHQGLIVRRCIALLMRFYGRFSWRRQRRVSVSLRPSCSRSWCWAPVPGWRQLLNALRIVVLYNRLRTNPQLEILPRTFFFAGKAAPAYQLAKVIIGRSPIAN